MAGDGPGKRATPADITDLLVTLRKDLERAAVLLREYAAENAHGRMANIEHMDRCVAGAGFRLDRARVVLRTIESELPARGSALPKPGGGLRGETDR